LAGHGGTKFMLPKQKQMTYKHPETRQQPKSCQKVEIFQIVRLIAKYVHVKLTHKMIYQAMIEP
jgi:hypothetical protein